MIRTSVTVVMMAVMFAAVAAGADQSSESKEVPALPLTTAIAFDYSGEAVSEKLPLQGLETPVEHWHMEPEPHGRRVKQERDAALERFTQSMAIEKDSEALWFRLVVPSDAPPLEPGEYEIRLFIPQYGEMLIVLDIQPFLQFSRIEPSSIDFDITKPGRYAEAFRFAVRSNTHWNAAVSLHPPAAADSGSSSSHKGTVSEDLFFISAESSPEDDSALIALEEEGTPIATGRFQHDSLYTEKKLYLLFDNEDDQTAVRAGQHEDGRLIITITGP